MKSLAIGGLVLYSVFLALVLTLGNAFAQVPMEPQTALEVVGLLPQLQMAIEAKNWALVAVISLMTITWLIKRFALNKDGSQDNLLPIVSAALGAAMGGSVSVMTGSGDPATGALGGMLMGNAASGMYDTFVKTAKKRIKKEIQDQ